MLNPNPPILPEPPQPYNLQAIQQNFQFTFNIERYFDAQTPILAIQVANEIQRRMQNSMHPARVLMYNQMAYNAFDNEEFRVLVWNIVQRLFIGFQNREFTPSQFQSFATMLIPTVVGTYAGWLICSEPSVQHIFAQLPIADRTQMQENASRWQRITSVAQGAIPFEPLEAMGMTAGNPALVMAAAHGGNLRTSAQSTVSGAFKVAAAPSTVQAETVSSRWGNNGSDGANRYRRQLEADKGILQGSMQTAMGAAMARPIAMPVAPLPADQHELQHLQPMTDPLPPEQNWQNRNRTTVMPAALLGATPEPQAPEEPETEAPLAHQFELEIGKRKHVVVSRLTPELGRAQWRAFEGHAYTPAINVRTHVLNYFKTSEGLVIAIAQSKSKEEVRTAMQYEAHAIDPSKGHPLGEEVPHELPPEAEVVYKDDFKLEDVQLAHSSGMIVDSTRSLIDNTIFDVEMMEQRPVAYRTDGTVEKPLVFASAQEASEARGQIGLVLASRSFKEAHEKLLRVKSAALRKLVNQWLVERINVTMASEVGIAGVQIVEFNEETGGELFTVIRTHFGDGPADLLIAQQAGILQSLANIRDVTADEYPDSLKSRAFYIDRRIVVTVINQTDDTMALDMPSTGAATVDEKVYPFLYAVIHKTLEETGKAPVYAHLLVTRDNVVYRMYRSAINAQCLLLGKVADQNHVL